MPKLKCTFVPSKVTLTVAGSFGSSVPFECLLGVCFDHEFLVLVKGAGFFPKKWQPNSGHRSPSPKTKSLRLVRPTGKSSLLRRIPRPRPPIGSLQSQTLKSPASPPESQPKRAKTLQGISKTLDGLAKTLEGISKTLDGFAETLEGIPRTLHGFAETLEGIFRTLHGFAETLEGIFRTLHGFAETLEGIFRTLHGFAETLEGISKTLDGFAENPHSPA